MFVYIWEYEVAPANRATFEREYGPEGRWVILFSRAPGYLGSSLLRDRTRPGRFVTVDRWESEEAHAAFRARFTSEFEALDVECERLTESETLIGHFQAEGPTRSSCGGSVRP